MCLGSMIIPMYVDMVTKSWPSLKQELIPYKPFQTSVKPIVSTPHDDPNTPLYGPYDYLWVGTCPLGGGDCRYVSQWSRLQFSVTSHVIGYPSVFHLKIFVLEWKINFYFNLYIRFAFFFYRISYRMSPMLTPLLFCFCFLLARLAIPKPRFGGYSPFIVIKVY